MYIYIYLYSLISLIAGDFPKSPPLAPVANDVRSQSSSVSPAISSFGLSFRNRASSWRSVEALVVLRPHVAPPDGIWWKWKNLGKCHQNPTIWLCKNINQNESRWMKKQWGWGMQHGINMDKFTMTLTELRAKTHKLSDYINWCFYWPWLNDQLTCDHFSMISMSPPKDFHGSHFGTRTVAEGMV